MNKKIFSIITGLIFITLPFSVAARDVGAGKHHVFNLKGTGYMYESVEDLDGDGAATDDALCFDVDLYNATNQQLIGTGTDCLSALTPTDNGVALVATTYFHLRSGSLVVRGNTSVQPVFHSTVTPDGLNMTHITGAAGNGDAVIHGTGRFMGAAGTARLSGMVDLSSFTAQPGDPITFDCLFVVDMY